MCMCVYMCVYEYTCICVSSHSFILLAISHPHSPHSPYITSYWPSRSPLQVLCDKKMPRNLRYKSRYVWLELNPEPCLYWSDALKVKKDKVGRWHLLRETDLIVLCTQYMNSIIRRHAMSIINVRIYIGTDKCFLFAIFMYKRTDKLFSPHLSILLYLCVCVLAHPCSFHRRSSGPTSFAESPSKRSCG